MAANRLREFRERNMISKVELARGAGISPNTLDRVEKGLPTCFFKHQETCNQRLI